MMYTLDIEHGAEVGLNHDLNHMLHGLTLFFEFRIPQEAVPVLFILPYHYDELVEFLFNVSLTKTIDHAFFHVNVCGGKTYLSGYDFHLVDAADHQTNITPEFMSSISKWSELLS